MGTHVRVAVVGVIICCLVHDAVAVHKKIIVKVPHLIKHIHHDHFKPVHLHKVHAKKVEHHHDDHETPPIEHGDWKQPQTKLKKVKHHKTPYGSFSDIKPVLLHQDADEDLEHFADDKNEHKATQRHEHGQRLELGDSFEYHQGNGQEFEHDSRGQKEVRSRQKEVRSRKRRLRNKGEEIIIGNNRPNPVDMFKLMNADPSSGEYSEEDWNMSGEDLGGLRGQGSFFSRQRYLGNGEKKRKSKQVSLRYKHATPEFKNDGWKPITFSNWKDFSDSDRFEAEYSKNGGHTINSGETYIEGINEGFNHKQQDISIENNERKRKKQKRKKKQNQSKKIEVNYESANTNQNESPHQQLIRQNYQLESPSVPVVPQAQLVHPLQTQQFHTQAILPQQDQKAWPVNLQQQQKQWTVQQPLASIWNVQPPSSAQASQPEKQYVAQQPADSVWNVQPSLPAQPSQPLKVMQQYVAQHPATSVWNVQPTSVAQPTQPSNVVWSGHHLQMPHHTMWHVQQHSGSQSLPLQALSVNQHPLQTLSVNQHPLQTLSVNQHPLQTLSVNQHPLQTLQIQQPALRQQPRTQLQQESVAVNRVVPPEWMTSKSRDPHSPMTQHWEQHVQTSGRDGPSSSYKVEVINYMDQKGNRQ